MHFSFKFNFVSLPDESSRMLLKRRTLFFGLTDADKRETEIVHNYIVGHRASPNAEYLKRLLTETPLKKYLSSMQKYTYKQQREKHRTALNVKQMEQEYRITQTQAKRLDTCGFSKVTLKRLYKEAPQDFDRAVKRRGVRSKVVREKLHSHYRSTLQV